MIGSEVVAVSSSDAAYVFTYFTRQQQRQWLFRPHGLCLMKRPHFFIYRPKLCVVCAIPQKPPTTKQCGINSKLQHLENEHIGYPQHCPCVAFPRYVTSVDWLLPPPPSLEQGNNRTISHVSKKQCKTRRKARGYWKDYSNVRKEILRYVQQRDGVTSFPSEEAISYHRMPSANELRQAGFYVLVLAIINHHGGFHHVANTIGLYHSHRTKGYWDKFENVAKEIANFSNFPTCKQLANACRLDLAKAIHKHGGFPAVAERLGTTAKKRRRRYWHNLQVLHKELLHFMEKNQLEQLPSITLLRSAKRWDLMSAIRLHGGLYEVSRKTMLPLSPKSRRPRGYWMNMDHLKRELNDFHSSMSRCCKTVIHEYIYIFDGLDSAYFVSFEKESTSRPRRSN